MSEYNKIINEIKKEFPKFKLVYKDDSKFMKFLNICLKIITFGQMKTFMTQYITTIGNTIYVPESWEDEGGDQIWKVIVLRHERIHLRQKKKYGAFLFSILYLLILPTVFAFFRKKFEQEAYEESLRAIAEYRGYDNLLEVNKEAYIKYFTGADYFWTWPFRRSIGRWYDETIDKIRSEND